MTWIMFYANLMDLTCTGYPTEPWVSMINRVPLSRLYYVARVLRGD